MAYVVGADGAVVHRPAHHPNPQQLLRNAAGIARAIARSARLNVFAPYAQPAIAHYGAVKSYNQIAAAGEQIAGGYEQVAKKFRGSHYTTNTVTQSVAHKTEPPMSGMMIDHAGGARQAYAGGASFYGPRAKKIMKKSRTARGMYGKLTTRFAYPTGLNKKFSDVKTALDVSKATEMVAAPTTVGYIYTSLFKQIITGTSATTRIGRRIVCHSVQIELQISTPTFVVDCANLAAQDTVMQENCFDSIVNIAVVRNLQTNGTAATVTDIWDNLSDNVPLRNMANTMQFQVLKHKQIRISPEWNSAFEGTDGVSRCTFKGIVKYVNMYWKCAELINYSNSGDDIANIVDNNVMLLAWTDNRAKTATATYGTPVSIEANLRVRYTDLQ